MAEETHVRPICDLANQLGVFSDAGESSRIVIVDTGTQTVGVTVDAVEEVLTVQEEQIERLPGTENALIDSIAKLGDRLVALLEPSTIFAIGSLA